MSRGPDCFAILEARCERICIVGSWVGWEAGWVLKEVSFFTNMSFTIVHIYQVVSVSGTVARMAKTRRFLTWVLTLVALAAKNSLSLIMNQSLSLIVNKMLTKKSLLTWP